MKEGTKFYSCGDRSSTFETEQELLRFESSHLEKPPCSCAPKRNASRHQNRAHLHEILTCDFCKSSFKHKENLRRHIQDIHIESVGEGWKCEFCGKIFKLKKYLKIHVSIVHLEKNESTCRYCNKTFKRNADMKKHVRYVHNEVKNFECSLCSRRFAVKSTVTKHIKRHYKNGIVPGEKMVEGLIVRLDIRKNV